MKYAVIKIKGRQYKVRENEELDIDNLQLKEGDKLKIDDVLLLVDENKTEIGQPVLNNVFVEASVVKNYRGEKIRVATYKAKSRYRRVIGFRHSLSKIRIEKISSSKSTGKAVKPAKTAKPVKKTISDSKK